MAKTTAPKTNNTNRKAQNSVVAGVAGAGGGSSLVLFAQNLPESNHYKSVLVLIAPSLSVAISLFWKWASKELDTFLRERKVSSLQDKMAAQIKAEIDNPETTEEDREILKQKLRQMKMKKIEDLGKRIDNISFED